MNEFWMNRISVYYQGLKITIRKKQVYQELMELRMSLHEVKYILENGFDCPRGKRKKGIIERCIRVDKKVIKAVVQRIQAEEEEVWLLRHVGMFGWKKGRFNIGG